MFNKYRSHKKTITKIIAISLSITAALVAYYTYLQLIKPVAVIVATKDLETSRRITESDITIETVSQRDMQDKTYQVPEKLIGQYAASPIYRGQQIIDKQITDNPNKLATAVKGIKKGETIFEFTTSQAMWPHVLRDGDLVTVEVVLPGQDAKDIAIGRVIGSIVNSTATNVKRLTEAETISPDQTEITIKTDIAAARRIVTNLPEARIIYLLPRHPGEGGLNYDTNSSNL